MMFNKNVSSALIPLLLGTVLFNGVVNAAQGDRIGKIINISATIPSATFEVKPLYGDWPTNIELTYDQGNDTFNSYTSTLIASTQEGLAAFLQQRPVMTNGDSEVELEVKLNDTTLDSGIKTIVSNVGDAVEQHQVELSIGPKSGSTYTDVGMYSGVVNMVFEDHF